MLFNMMLCYIIYIFKIELLWELFIVWYYVHKNYLNGFYIWIEKQIEFILKCLILFKIIQDIL